MAAYSEKGSLCEAVPGFKGQRIEKKKENRVDRQPGTG